MGVQVPCRVYAEVPEEAVAWPDPAALGDCIPRPVQGTPDKPPPLQIGQEQLSPTVKRAIDAQKAFDSSQAVLRTTCPGSLEAWLPSTPETKPSTHELDPCGLLQQAARLSCTSLPASVRRSTGEFSARSQWATLPPALFLRHRARLQPIDIR
jgi:hypothetical protein